MEPISVAVAGLGNCASSLIEGISYYRQHPNIDAGLLFPQLCGYSVRDIEIVAAFDVSERKVGRCIAEAIYEPPNNFVRVPGVRVDMHGLVYRGPRMAAGEVGQMVIAESPSDQRHDRPGCLELLSSDLATVARYCRLAGVTSEDIAANSSEQLRRICRLALSGDSFARQAVLETCRHLGIGIANAVWALDAETVVIDGAITEAWPLVMPAIREQFPQGKEFLNFNNLILRQSALRGEASIVGAATLPYVPLFSAGQSVGV